MQVDVSRCRKQLCNGFMAEPWWGCKGRGVKPLKYFGLFTFRRQINSLKYERPCQLIYFECKLNANMLQKYKDWVLESVRGLSFLYRLPDIKIAWINPWGRVQLVSVNFTLCITILFTFFVIFFKVCQEFELISTTL